MRAMTDSARSYPDDATFSIWRARDGWEHRVFERPAPAGAPPRGSILFQGGRGDIVEKYLETLDGWHDAGWAIASLDWRGQGKSGRLTPDPHCGDIDDFATYITDLREFWAAWRERTPGPYVVMGHSMGGHLVLRALVEGAIDPAAAVLVAPMLGLKAPGSPAVGQAFARLMTRLGDPGRPAWKGNERPNTKIPRQKLLTNDARRYADELWWQQHDPALVTGPPSWRWLERAFASTRALAADSRLAKTRIPVLMLVAEADQLVHPRAALAIARDLPDVRVVRFGSESAHEILREADPVRDRALGEIDVFLAAHAPRA